MANGSATLARIQGQGLVETAPVAAEVQGVGMTPAGAALKGASPDAAKMAGTPPAKVNAVRMAAQDVGSRRLGALREMAQPDLKADARVSSNVVKASTVLGKVDEAVGSYVTRILNESFNSTLLSANTTFANLQPGLMVPKLKEDGTQEVGPDGKPVMVEDVKLKNAIAAVVANNGTATDADIALINAALKKVNAKGTVTLDKDVSALTNATTIANGLFTNLTPEQMTKGFADAVSQANQNTDVSDFLDSAEADKFALDSSLVPAGTENPSQALEEIIRSVLPPGTDLSKMKWGDVVQAIQTWKTENFKDVSEYQKTLQDPNSSTAQRQLALENLRNLGKVGVIAADAKVGDLEAQMRDGDQLKIGDEKSGYQEFEISDFFTKPESLAQLKGWLDNPATAPSTLRPWIEANRDAIENKMKQLNPALEELANKAQANLDTVKLPENVQVDDSTVEFFYGKDIFKPTIAAKTVPESFALLKDPDKGPVLVTLMKRLETLPGGKAAFAGLSVEQLNTIIKDRSVDAYIDNLKASQEAKNFVEIKDLNETNFAGNFTRLMKNIGKEDAGLRISRLVNRDLSEFSEIFASQEFKDAGLEGFVINGKLNIAKIKEQVQSLASADNNGLISGEKLNTLVNILDTKFVGLLNNAVARPPLEKIESNPAKQEEIYRQKTGAKTPDQIVQDKKSAYENYSKEWNETGTGTLQVRGKELKALSQAKNQAEILGDKYKNLSEGEVKQYFKTWGIDEYSFSQIRDDNGDPNPQVIKHGFGLGKKDTYENPYQVQARLYKYYLKNKTAIDSAKKDYPNYEKDVLAPARQTYWNNWNDYNNYKNNLPQAQATYREGFSNWWNNDYLPNFEKNNKTIQDRYDKLGRILGGLIS